MRRSSSKASLAFDEPARSTKAPAPQKAAHMPAAAAFVVAASGSADGVSSSACVAARFSAIQGDALTSPTGYRSAPPAPAEGEKRHETSAAVHAAPLGGARSKACSLSAARSATSAPAGQAQSTRYESLSSSRTKEAPSVALRETVVVCADSRRQSAPVTPKAPVP